MITLQKWAYSAELKEKIKIINSLPYVQKQMSPDVLTMESFLILDEFLNATNNNQPIIGLNGCCLFIEKYFRELYILLSYKDYSAKFWSMEDYTDYVEEQLEMKNNDPRKNTKTEYNFMTFVDKVQSELWKSCISDNLKKEILDFYNNWRHVLVHWLFRRWAFSISGGEKMTIWKISLVDPKAEVIQIEKDHLLFRSMRIKDVCSIGLLEWIDLVYNILEWTYDTVFNSKNK